MAERGRTLTSRCGTSSTRTPSGSVMRSPSTTMGVGRSVSRSISARARQCTERSSMVPFIGGKNLRTTPARVSPCRIRAAPATASSDSASNPTRPIASPLVIRRSRTFTKRSSQSPVRTGRAFGLLAVNPDPSGDPRSRFTRPMDGTLYIIDALNFLFRAFHALPPLTTSKGLPTGAVYGLAQMILRIEREQKPTHLCVVFDAPGRTFREDIFAAYKADRPPMPPELAAQVELTHQLVEAFALPVLSVPGVEADDVIATLATAACAGGLQVVICSSDKDLMQLCCPQISLLDTMYNRLIGPAEVQLKFGVTPDRVGDVLALMGDSIDNVPGVAGVGPKTAAELINRFGSLEALLANIGEVKNKKGQAIAAARAAVSLSRQLVALRQDVELPRPLASLSRVPHD